MIKEIKIENVKNYADAVTVYVNGNATTFCREGDAFAAVCSVWEGLLKPSRQMPALGVSLHNETIKELKKGTWLEFSFPETYANEGMWFDKLLVKLVPETPCFDIVRYTEKYGYEGRCLHFNLVCNTLSPLYEEVIKNL